jgi:hypothetical protein
MSLHVAWLFVLSHCFAQEVISVCMRCLRFVFDMLVLLCVRASLEKLVVLVNFCREVGVQLWFVSLGNGDKLYIPTGFLKLAKIGPRTDCLWPHAFMLDVVPCLSFMRPFLCARCLFDSAQRKHKPHRRAGLRISPADFLEFAFDFFIRCWFPSFLDVGVMLGDYCGARYHFRIMHVAAILRVPCAS